MLTNHLLISTNNTVKIKIGHFDVANSRNEKLLGVKFDSKLTFGDHISELCQKTSRKIHALSRVTPYMNISKRRILMNAFFKSQFSYCPLVWMCHSRANNSKINRLHEVVSIHNRNIQILATEMFKIKNDLSPEIMTERFEQRNEHHYNLRNNIHFITPQIRTVYHSSESISFLGPKIWNILPDRLKNATSLEAFKIQIKKWKPQNCPCRLCRVYVQNVGFV